MIVIQRQEALIDLVEKKGVISVSELSETLSVSQITIRRDLGHLAKEGLVERIHGGALKKVETFQSSFFARQKLQKVEKEKIGKRAAELIKDGDVVFFDASSTTLEVAKNLPESIHITAITPALYTTCELCKKPQISIILIGGEIEKQTMSTIGSSAIRKIRQYNTDKLFLSTHAVSLKEGIFERLLALVEVKRAMIKSSKEVILLADHSKFGFVSLLKVIPIKQINVVITDDKTSPEYIKILEGEGVEVLIA